MSGQYGKRKPVTCKRCSATDLTWVQSPRTSRYYLAATTGTGSFGKTLAFQPHKCPQVGEIRAAGSGYTRFTGSGWEFCDINGNPITEGI